MYRSKTAAQKRFELADVQVIDIKKNPDERGFFAEAARKDWLPDLFVNFKPAYTRKEGSIEIFEALKTGKLQESLKTKTVDWYKHLLNSFELISNVELRDTVL